MNNRAAVNRAEVYSISRYITEIYDQTETQRDDLVLIKSLIGRKSAWILEPFCGHGRLLIPLAMAGHKVVGMDLSQVFLRCLQERIEALPLEVRRRVVFKWADVIKEEWPSGFNVVILGANCLYELATPEEQEHCIRSAARALVPGGYLYLDNGHMEGDLDPSWCKSGVQENVFPTGICADGTRVRGTSEVIWYDRALRLVRFRRTVTVQTPHGRVSRQEWVQQKHPPSTEEMKRWLGAHGFVIKGLWGNRDGEPYTDSSPRAVFWARKATGSDG
jgi:SAM-dependent methyltransferase